MGSRKLRICHYPSPNRDERPAGITIDTLVVHATVFDTLEDVIRHFSDACSKVSAHYTIDRDGTVAAHVPEELRAWHAGQSRMRDGRQSVNDFSIGVELVNLNDGLDPFPDEQVAALRELLREIAGRHPIRYVVPHHECAYPPGRKTDPAGFDLAWLGGVPGGLNLGS